MAETAAASRTLRKLLSKVNDGDFRRGGELADVPEPYSVRGRFPNLAGDEEVLTSAPPPSVAVARRGSLLSHDMADNDERSCGEVERALCDGSRAYRPNTGLAFNQSFTPISLTW